MPNRSWLLSEKEEWGFSTTFPKPTSVQLYDKRIDLVNGHFVVERPTAQSVEFPADEPLSIECQHFIDCVRTRATPKTDGQDGWRVLKVLEASQRSLSMNGEPVQLEPLRSLEVLRA